MYTGKTPSALRSRQLLGDALLLLRKEKPYAQIAAKEICERAGLSRQTFYQIFESKDEIMEFSLARFQNPAAALSA